MHHFDMKIPKLPSWSYALSRLEIHFFKKCTLFLKINKERKRFPFSHPRVLILFLWVLIIILPACITHISHFTTVVNINAEIIQFPE